MTKTNDKNKDKDKDQRPKTKDQRPKTKTKRHNCKIKESQISHRQSQRKPSETETDQGKEVDDDEEEGRAILRVRKEKSLIVTAKFAPHGGVGTGGEMKAPQAIYFLEPQT